MPVKMTKKSGGTGSTPAKVSKPVILDPVTQAHSDSANTAAATMMLRRDLDTQGYTRVDSKKTKDAVGRSRFANRIGNEPTMSDVTKQALNIRNTSAQRSGISPAEVDTYYHPVKGKTEIPVFHPPKQSLASKKKAADVPVLAQYKKGTRGIKMKKKK